MLQKSRDLTAKQRMTSLVPIFRQVEDEFGSALLHALGKLAMVGDEFDRVESDAFKGIKQYMFVGADFLPVLRSI